jgi:hypothetical protein
MTPFQRNNLLRFLDRVELKGMNEADAFVEIINILRTEEKPEEPITDNQSTN